MPVAKKTSTRRKSVEDLLLDPMITLDKHATSMCNTSCCSDREDFGKKIIMTIFGLLLVYLIVWVGVKTRNEVREYDFIGLAEQQERMISLEGVGKVEVVPNLTVATMGTTIEAPTVDEAQKKNTEVMNAFLEKLTGLGVEKKDVQTGNYSVNPLYNYSDDGKPTVRGYQASQSLTVKIRDAEKTGQVLALAGELGLNNVGGLQFTIDDEAAYLAEARQQALEEIRNKAKQLSADLQINLDEIVSYSEYRDGGVGPYPMYSMAKDMATSAAPQIEAGTQDITLHVNVTFSMNR